MSRMTVLEWLEDKGEREHPYGKRAE